MGQPVGRDRDPGFCGGDAVARAVTPGWVTGVDRLPYGSCSKRGTIGFATEMSQNVPKWDILEKICRFRNEDVL